jgi:hypothetical protein
VYCRFLCYQRSIRYIHIYCRFLCYQRSIRYICTVDFYVISVLLGTVYFYVISVPLGTVYFYDGRKNLSCLLLTFSGRRSDNLARWQQFRPETDVIKQLYNFLKRLPGAGSEPGSSQFHLFSHFHYFTAEPQRLPKTAADTTNITYLWIFKNQTWTVRRS